MNLLRVVIIGVEETPYHDSLFFFYLHFPSDYPTQYIADKWLMILYLPNIMLFLLDSKI